MLDFIVLILIFDLNVNIVYYFKAAHEYRFFSYSKIKNLLITVPFF